ncbi:MAG: RidA family protein [Hyphomicrobiales bacterium]|nr:RidA family protein [Hyphomicrobiales bacterium]
MNRIVQPPGWPRPKGYANGVLAEGKMLFVAGQVGWNEREEFESPDFVRQTEQALRNIVAVLTAGGAKPEHIARMTWYVIDKAEYLDRLAEIGKVYKDILGAVYPAMSLVQVAGLVEVGAKLEIEVTAVIPNA